MEWGGGQKKKEKSILKKIKPKGRGGKKKRFEINGGRTKRTLCGGGKGVGEGGQHSGKNWWAISL